MTSRYFRGFLAIALPLLVVTACSSYGQGAANDTSSQNAGDDDDDDGSVDPSTPPPTTTPPTPGTPPPGTPPPSSGFGVPCPTCPSGETCIAAGCDGATPNVCATPTEVTGTQTFRVFICPAGDKLTTEADAQCESPTSEVRPAAGFHVPSSANGYSVTVFDSSNYYFSTAIGGPLNACTNGTNCGGGTGAIALPIPPQGATLGFAPKPAASGCTTIRLAFQKK